MDALLRRLTRSRRAQLDRDEVVLAHDCPERGLRGRWRSTVQQAAG